MTEMPKSLKDTSMPVEKLGMLQSRYELQDFRRDVTLGSPWPLGGDSILICTKNIPEYLLKKCLKILPPKSPRDNWKTFEKYLMVNVHKPYA